MIKLPRTTNGNDLVNSTVALAVFIGSTYRSIPLSPSHRPPIFRRTGLILRLLHVRRRILLPLGSGDFSDRQNVDSFRLLFRSVRRNGSPNGLHAQSRYSRLHVQEISREQHELPQLVGIRFSYYDHRRSLWVSFGVVVLCGRVLCCPAVFVRCVAVLHG